MTPVIRSLIVLEAIRELATSRTDLAIRLQTEIKARYGDGAVPTKETLVKMISDARNHTSPLDRPWHMGLLSEYPIVSANAIRYILAIQTWLEHQTPKDQLLQTGSQWLSVRQALWVSRLCSLIDGKTEADILDLQRLSRTYAEYELIHELSKASGKFDTTQIDTAVREGRLVDWLESQHNRAFDGVSSVLNAGANPRRGREGFRHKREDTTPRVLGSTEVKPDSDGRLPPVTPPPEQLGMQLEEIPGAMDKKGNGVLTPEKLRWLLEALQKVRQQEDSPERQLIPEWLRKPDREKPV